MLYTVGHRESYEAGLNKGHLLKQGKRENYGGGIVFLTREDAERWIGLAKKPDYGVYGLITTYNNTSEPEHDLSAYGIKCRQLVRDAQIVRLG